MAKILYVEDDEDNAYMMSKRLAQRGFDVVLARDGEAAVPEAERERPDLVLMDLGLPGLDGWEVTRRLKANPDTATIPIIAVSSHAMKGDREKALEAGCDDYDTKPIEFERLLEKINALLPGST